MTVLIPRIALSQRAIHNPIQYFTVLSMLPNTSLLARGPSLHVHSSGHNIISMIECFSMYIVPFRQARIYKKSYFRLDVVGAQGDV
jgi:hypothetical protein